MYQSDMRPGRRQKSYPEPGSVYRLHVNDQGDGRNTNCKHVVRVWV